MNLSDLFYRKIKIKSITLFLFTDKIVISNKKIPLIAVLLKVLNIKLIIQSA